MVLLKFQICLIVTYALVSLVRGYPRDVIRVLTVDNGGQWGEWHSPEFCPADTYAAGYRMKIEEPQGTGDDTGLNAIALNCKSEYGRLGGEEITSGTSGWGTWGTYADCPKPDGIQGFMTGFRLQVEKPQGDGDDTAANLMEVHCSRLQSGASYEIDPPTKGKWGSFGSWSESCPEGSAICGIQTKIEPWQGSDGDDTALNDTGKVNPLYNDIRYNDKTRYNDNLTGTNPQLEMKRIIVEVKEDFT